jgi:hypothetical protein
VLVPFSPSFPLQKAALSVFGSLKVSNKGKRLLKTNPVSCHFHALGWTFWRGGRGKAPWFFFKVLKKQTNNFLETLVDIEGGFIKVV